MDLIKRKMLLKNLMISINMKRTVVLFTFILCTACEIDVDSSTGLEIVPNPSSSTVYYNNEDILLRVNKIGDNNVNMKEVKFYLDNEEIGSAVKEPFELHYIPLNVSPGWHNISYSFNYEEKGVEGTNTITWPTPLVFSLRIGDKFQGGLVYSLDSKGEHGLIVATEDVNVNGQSEFIWGPKGKQDMTKEDGAYNTKIMASICTQKDQAGYLFKSEYTYNGYRDWYIPTSEEVTDLLEYPNLRTLFSDKIYWTSSGIGEAMAGTFTCFPLMSREYKDKDSKYALRLIRKF